METTMSNNNKSTAEKIFPRVAITEVDSQTAKTTYIHDLPNPEGLSVTGFSPARRGSEDDRYFTASSGDEDQEDVDDEYDADNDNDDDYDDMCIMLDSDNEEGDDGSLSGLHINLKTLQAVSNMLAHYIPIIQRDVNGNPLFVAPPPPTSICDSPSALQPTSSKKLPDSPAFQSNEDAAGDDSAHDFEMALQELENVISAEDESFFVDKMSELTEVMEKMTHYAEDDAAQTSIF